ncbi:MAG: Peptidoglycan binding protein, partial [Parcubacteria group bacterium Gr01-1014_70]
SIYPEGRVTGFYGTMTASAVKKFQAKHGLGNVGRVGPRTMAKIHELLERGAGASGKVPPGLLIAPGIQKKLDFVPQPLPGQRIPPGIAKKLGTTTLSDTTAPAISNIRATSTTGSGTHITWTTNENSTSKVWYSSTSPVNLSSASLGSSSSLVVNHDITLGNLATSTTYYYIVDSSDAAGNRATSSQQSFATLSQ